MVNNPTYTVTKLTVHRERDNPIFGDSVIELSLEDEGGGIFLTMQQQPNDFGPGGTLRLDFEEIDVLYEAIRYLKMQADKDEQARESLKQPPHVVNDYTTG